ncbi:hypothetical protein CONPUDRAFT_155122 [Coniophora puteana RWD-64-598 SS2]|uniref:Uncharacterized protein n=1 Tax=Coniophora puteana (strain RWD-64-598) TaxID=741705 RepID=A0A5M3MKH4_CONPW|nr:uncharacterized protein CONPUDRAFT_155122 [Coniophora puteana RWD-64-598 SS2]EIW79729.1 hypothetical protein CONPUDRAFT_155122 [Coniophora puteana RWD-64-598 SS2]
MSTNNGPTALSSIANLLPKLALEISAATNTPFTPYAKMNHSVATAQEACQVQTILTDLSSTINIAKGIFSELSRAVTVLEEALVDHTRLVSSSLRIPVELLSTIFILSRTSVLSNRRIDRLPLLSSSLTVNALPSGSLNVAQVCRKWRDVTLNIPKLWNMVGIRPTSERITSDMIPAPLKPLTRVRLLPTFVTLDVSETAVRRAADFDGSQQNIPAYNTWMSQFQRVTHLTLDNVDLEQLAYLLEDNPEEDNAIASYFDHLTHLHICTVYNADMSAFLEYRTWENLTFLTLDMEKSNGLDKDYVIPLFHNFPNLIELFIQTLHKRFGRLDTMVTSPKLRSFALVAVPGSDDPEDSEDFDLEVGPFKLLDILTLPALVDLVLTAPPSGELDFLRRFLKESGCHLSSLTFVNYSEETKTFEDAAALRLASLGVFGLGAAVYTDAAALAALGAAAITACGELATFGAASVDFVREGGVLERSGDRHAAEDGSDEGEGESGSEGAHFSDNGWSLDWCSR